MGNMTIKISAIIPYYNIKGELLLQCIKSILCQKVRDYEIIIVNDGSDKFHTDYLKKIEKMDSRIMIINQDNHGTSAARNAGIKRAKGEYITFIDPDDMITPNFFSEAYLIAKDKNADCVVGYTYYTMQRDLKVSMVQNPKIESVGMDKYKIQLILPPESIKNHPYFGRGAVARLVKRSIVKDVFFGEDIKFSEDIIWNLDAIHKCKNVYLVHQIWYIYWHNQESFTKKYNPEIVSQCRYHIKALSQRIDFNNEGEYVAYCSHIQEILRSYIYGCYYGRKESKKSVWVRYLQFCRLCKNKPWIYARDRVLLIKGDWKSRLGCLLIKTRLLFWALFVKNHVKI